MPLDAPLEYETPRSSPVRARLSAFIRRARRWLVRAACIALFLVIAGYFSDLICRGICERRTARWIFVTPLGGTSPHVQQEDSQRIFQQAGVAILPAHRKGSNDFPVAHVGRAHFAIPFLVEVEYGYAQGPLAGEGGRVRYICLFGFVVRIGETVEWIS